MDNPQNCSNNSPRGVGKASQYTQGEWKVLEHSEAMTQHTPGDWFAHGRAVHAKVGHITMCLASCMTGHFSAREEEANARLIAAAPKTAAERDNLKAVLFQREAEIERLKHNAKVHAKLLDKSIKLVKILGAAKILDGSDGYNTEATIQIRAVEKAIAAAKVGA